MSVYREVRVRPVVRYIVTLFEEYDDGKSVGRSSVAYGVFDNVQQANIVGEAIADREMVLHTELGPNDSSVASKVNFEPARRLKIDWTRGPGEPQEAIRWHLVDEDAPPPTA